MTEPNETKKDRKPRPTYNDLITTGFVGLRPRDDDTV